VIEVVFWVAAGLIAYTHLGYPLLLWLLSRLPRRPVRPYPLRDLPSVTLIIAAHDEEEVIEAKVRNALELEYPSELLGVVVASDGSSDRTAALARDAGAHLVLDLPRGGKIAAQNAAADRARGEILAFSDANSFWDRDALLALVQAFGNPAVGYACGQLRLLDPDGDNQEGTYWRFEIGLRALESRLGGITAGNGAIYAVRREAYLPLRPAASHDLSLPFELARRRLRSVYVPEARAREKMLPTLAGELARKRRMMVGLWDIVIGERMLSPRGYRPLFAFQLFSHRILRYLTPFLHLLLLGSNLVLLDEGTVYVVALAVQLALLAAAVLSPLLPLAPLRLARYYVAVTASIALGLWDRARHGAPGAWEQAPGSR
jgi:cellulose synthase/poly-beta-1,6-N-acetylglucosamine synthase-like glycosyltransferase